jgi:hypothetical protein
MKSRRCIRCRTPLPHAVTLLRQALRAAHPPCYVWVRVIAHPQRSGLAAVAPRAPRGCRTGPRGRVAPGSDSSDCGSNRPRPRGPSLGPPGPSHGRRRPGRRTSCTPPSPLPASGCASLALPGCPWLLSGLLAAGSSPTVRCHLPPLCHRPLFSRGGPSGKDRLEEILGLKKYSASTANNSAWLV